MARVRGKIAYFASSRETGRTVARAHVPRGSWIRKIDAAAGTSDHGLAPKKEGFPPVQCPFNGPGSTATSATRRARSASLRALPSPERQAAQWRARACHAKSGCALEAADGTSHYGLAPKESDLSPVQCLFYVRRMTTAGATWRARVARSLASRPPERQVEQWRARACHAEAGCANGCRSWQIAPRSRTEEGGLPAGAMSF